MQKKQDFFQNDQETELVLQRQHLIKQLGDTHQRLPVLSSEKIKAITSFTLTLPDIYQDSVFKVISEHIVICIVLHYLDIFTIFQEKAVQEKIDQEEIIATFEETFRQHLSQMLELKKKLSVRSIESLITLDSITVGFYRPSQTTTAESAQYWVYNLPEMYISRLNDAGLLDGDVCDVEKNEI